MVVTGTWEKDLKAEDPSRLIGRLSREVISGLEDITAEDDDRRRENSETVYEIRWERAS